MPQVVAAVHVGLIRDGATMDVYAHLRILVSMILGLGITRILAGLSRMLQAPKMRPGTGAHLVWSVAVLLHCVHFWWFEFAFRQVQVWHFGLYLLILFYAFALFLLASLLFPDVVHDRDGNEDYFMHRRDWFFAIFAGIFLLDLVDTRVKGADYFAQLGPEYLIRAGLAVMIAILAAKARQPRMVAALGLIWIAYDLSWIFRVYDML